MSVELTHKQAVQREKDIQDELERLKAKTEKTAEDQAKVGPLVEEFRKVHAHRLDLEHDAALAEVRSATGAPLKADDADLGPARAETEVIDRTRGASLGGKYRNPWDTSEVRYGRNGTAHELRERALDAIERMPHASDKVREVSTNLVETHEGTRMAEMVLTTTSPEYSSAFTKVIRARGQMAALNSSEQQALSRAMSLTDANGGYLVPFQLDPTVIIAANGSFNEIRKIARVVQVTSDVWHGISTAGVTGSWDAEGTEVSDDSPTIDQPAIPVHKGAVFVAQSFEVQEDATGLAGEVAKMIAFEKDRMEAVAFVTGSGSGQPTGIVTALTGTSSVVTSTTTDTFAVGDVYKLDGALPARYAANGSWLGHRTIYGLMRQFDTNGGSALWGQLADARSTTLLGRPDYVAEAMDGTVTALAENYVLIFGDFSNYVIADRLGTTLSYIPHLFGANGRPTGQSGWYAHFRVGADSVNDAAFRMLNVT
ncbi:phage major capsid protein [Nocardia gipuzkoensis]|uniref:phage major capsid protein n=1 Tax=Nocardia gipuzkoensis TaxID=2749991 RepID=UPI001E36BB7F|nr:phage major capsid protein [Nocardia gipuzkoensis]UGT65321.1 phage major capsid protein [Nocardia gipuzkoensis]